MLHGQFASFTRFFKLITMSALAVLLVACGGGGGGGGGGGATTQGIGGGGVKGPLAGAIVTAYAFDATQPGFKGAIIDTGTTDANAKITGLALTLPLTPPYILEFTSDAGTTDITTGVFPVITTMRTVLTQALLDTGEDVYATPLTTMATDLAVANADSNVAPYAGDLDGITTSVEFVAALPVAASQVASTLGFGIDSTIDIFDTPPLVDSTTDTTAEQTDVAAYRAAVEAVTAVVYEMDQQSSGTTPDSVLAELTSDLANDGVIDGTTETGVSTVLTTTTLDVLDQDPALLPIPNDPLGQTVGDVEAILDAETATTGTTTDTTELGDGTISTVVEPAETNPDIDGDGVMNADDAFPTDPSEDTDTDGDGTGNNADTDDDNDGWLDTEDDYSTDPAQFLDPALDRDSDTVANGTDNCPLNANTGQADTDGDGIGDACTGDNDGDGVLDVSDNCPVNSNPSQTDTNTDGEGDACDTDIDGDGTLNAADAFPNDSTETTDNDGDGIGDVADTDDDNDGLLDGVDPDPLSRDADGDGVFDNVDAFPTDPSESVNTDGDAFGNNADNDDDNDGLTDTQEVDTYFTKPLVADTDGDTLLDGAEVTAGTNPLLADTDADGVNDDTDVFPTDPSETIDTDSDGVGDNADAFPTDPSETTDTDSDGVGDNADAFPSDPTETTDTDSDGVGDNADAFPTDPLETTDTDSDGVGDNADAFPTDPSETTDTDSDGVGDNADVFPTDPLETTDTDSDGVGDNADAFPNDPAETTDTDSDGVGDNADAFPTDPLETTDTDSDGVGDNADAFPNDPAETTDTDSDGVGDNADAFPNDPLETTDTDNDTVGDNGDNCPADANTDQLNTDGDAQGNVCDADDDNDGLSDVDEATAGSNPLIVDTDGDGLTDGEEAGAGGTGTDPTLADTDGDTINDGAEVTAGTNPLLADTDSDTFNDNVDVCPLIADDQTDSDGNGVGDACDVDTDSDGVSDSIDNCPADANTDQLNTDGDAEGNVCDLDNDNDNLTDVAEAGLGTDPLLADTDSDTYNDDVDVFPLDVNEWADTDSDTVGDNGDNCPADANTDQLNTDGDAEGNVCDLDDDNDNLTDVAEAGLGTDPLLADTDSDTYNDDVDVFPLDVNEWADTDSDTVGDNGDNCPTVANAGQEDANVDGIGDACSVDMTGVQKLNMTVTNVTELNGVGSCDGDTIGDTGSLYATTVQTGTTLEMKTVWGDVLTGTVDTATGDYTLSGGLTTTNPFTSDVDVETVTVTGNAIAGTATATILNNYNTVDQCSLEYSLTTPSVYEHVGGEDYNGVYTLELAEDNGSGNAERNSIAVQFEISGSTMAIHLPYNDPNETFTNTSFDPNTGFFSFDIDGVEDYDDGSGSEEWHDKMTGILVRAPGEATLPSVALVIDGFDAEYDAIGGSGGVGTRLFINQSTEEGYGKRLSSDAFTRSIHYFNTTTSAYVDGIFMGMSHPPLKRATTTSDLYVEVLDVDGTTRLCTGLYSKRYTNNHYEPAVDMAAEQFQSQWYSYATCNTSTGLGVHNVINGMNYTVRIMDTGADGAVDGGDDTAVAGASTVVTADVSPAFFTTKPNVHDFALNGAKPSQTMKQGMAPGVIQLFGFFDANESMDFSWTGLSDAQKYLIEVADFGGSNFPTRFVLPASAVPGTETVTLPAGTLGMWDERMIRIRGLKDEAVAPAPIQRALTNSKWLMLKPGIQGLFNVEFIDTPIQLYLEGDMGDGINSSLSACTVTNNPGWACNSGTIDYSTNIVSLSMDNAGGLGTVTMDITFSDSANGTITGGTLATALSLVPAETHVRLVNPELAIRSLQPSGGVAQQTMAQLFNTMAGGELAAGNMFDKAVFKREDNGDLVVGTNANVGTTGKAFWSETTAGGSLPFTGEAAAFWQNPSTDGVAQKAGHYISNRTNSDWGLGAGLLEAATYKSVWMNAVDNASPTPVEPKWVFKRTYSAPDASVLVTPIHNQVTVNLTAGDVVATTGTGTGVGEVGNPIDITAEPTFGGLTWTGAIPAGGEWNIRFMMVGGPAAGIDLRTPWMDATTHPDLTDNGDGTWTWVNPDTSIMLESGDTVRVQIRARDGSAFTMLGAQRTGGTDDTVYLYIP